MHHQLAPFSQNHDGCWVFILIDGCLWGHLSPALDRPKPGDAVTLELVWVIVLHAGMDCEMCMLECKWVVLSLMTVIGTECLDALVNVCVQ